MGKARTPRFYFSLRSPYSWLAYRRLLAEYADVAELVEWVPFWEPDQRSEQALIERGGTFPYSAMSKAKHLYVLQDVGRLARAAGAPLTWPVDRNPVWEIPHLGYLVARREGLGPEYIAAAYRARWELGRDICDRTTVAEIGASLGLDPAEIAAASDDSVLRDDGVGVLLDICRDGVFGVPFFVHGFSRYWGLDRLAQFAADLRAARPPAAALPGPAPVTVGLGRSSDEGHAGGCG